MRADRLKPTIELPPTDTKPVKQREHPDYAWPATDDKGRTTSMGNMHPADVRRLSPYQAGDVVLVRMFALSEGGWINRPFVIERVMTKYLETKGYYVPRYKARPLTKDGRKWSGRWQYIYPGDIDRAYNAAGSGDDA